MAKTGHAIMRLLRSEALEGDRAVIVVTHDNRVFGLPIGLHAWRMVG